MLRTELFILGNGGHAAACADLAESTKSFSSIRKIDKRSQEALIEEWKREGNLVSLGLGVGMIKPSREREEIFQAVDSILQAKWPNLVSPHASLSPSCEIGIGCQVFPGAVVGAGVRLGDFSILNSGSIVEHGTQVGAYTHISTGAIVNGDCSIGAGSFIGSGSVVREGISLQPSSFIRMGERVLSNG